MSENKAKRVSNYELFFDLVVVLAFRQLTAAVHLDHIGLSEIFFLYQLPSPLKHLELRSLLL